MGRVHHIRKDICFYAWFIFMTVLMCGCLWWYLVTHSPVGFVLIVANPLVYMLGFFGGNLYFKMTANVVTSE